MDEPQESVTVIATRADTPLPTTQLRVTVLVLPEPDTVAYPTTVTLYGATPPDIVRVAEGFRYVVDKAALTPPVLGLIPLADKLTPPSHAA